jgi:hypothetical protein
MRSWLAGCMLGLAVLVGWTGCELGSADESVRASPLSVGGLYRDSAGGAIVSKSTGGTITQFNVIQRGDELQVVDNLGRVYRGTLSDNGYFEVKGIGPGGFEVQMSGTFGSTTGSAVMNGTWVEPVLYATVRATAAITSTGSGTNQTGSGTNQTGTTTNAP